MSIDAATRKGAPTPGPLAAAVALGLALALVLTGCGDGEDAQSATPSTPQTAAPTNDGDSTGTDTDTDTTVAPNGSGPVEVRATEVATLDTPIALAVRPGDDEGLYVAEQGGLVRRLSTAAGDRFEIDDAEVLDLSDLTEANGEQGLLGIAFSPDGSMLYVNHTDDGGDTRVAGYPMDGAVASADDPVELLAVAQPYPNHNGGHLVVDPDGMLWVGMGDGGAGDDPENRAQDPTTPLGKLLRIDPDTGAVEQVASGLRNPWRFSFDTDGSLWIGDVGQNRWEEIDHVAAGEIVGANFGWSAREGTHDNPGVDPEGRRGENPVDPVFEYTHDGGNCSITGGSVYRGTAVSSLVGAYLFADYCAGDLRAIRLNADGGFAEEIDLGVNVENPISFGTDQDGEMYVLSASGPLLRIEAA